MNLNIEPHKLYNLKNREKNLKIKETQKVLRRLTFLSLKSSRKRRKKLG